MLEFTGIGMHIKVKDIKASREFYEGLGFTPVFGYGSDEFRKSLPDGCGSAPEKYNGVTYKLVDGAELEIADGHIAVKPEDFQVQVHTAKISGMIRVKSIVPVLETQNERVSFPVRKYYWGSIEVALRDPDGVVLVFIAPYSEEELARIKELVDVEEVNP